MPIQPTANIWHNGTLIPWEKAQIHVLSHVVHYGSSVFEGIRCYAQPQASAIFRLPEHMQRLLDSAKIYRMGMPYSLDQLCTGVVDLVEEGVDVALRMGALEDSSSLTARKIASARHHVVGTPAYFARSGVPATPSELAAHDAVIYTRQGDTWGIPGSSASVRTKYRSVSRVRSGSMLLRVCGLPSWPIWDWPLPPPGCLVRSSPRATCAWC